MDPHFLIRSIKITDRHTEPRSTLQIGELKQELMTVELHLISSGNTTNIKDPIVISRIFEKLDKI